VLQGLYEKAKIENAANRCVVAQWGIQFEGADRDAFNQSISDDEFSNKNLYNLYKDAGATFSISSLRAHRLGECGCR
jgi:hypothetical protein